MARRRDGSARPERATRAPCGLRSERPSAVSGGSLAAGGLPVVGAGGLWLDAASVSLAAGDRPRRATRFAAGAADQTAAAGPRASGTWVRTSGGSVWTTTRAGGPCPQSSIPRPFTTSWLPGTRIEDLVDIRTAELLKGVCDIDLDALDVELPRGFGRG